MTYKLRKCLCHLKRRRDVQRMQTPTEKKLKNFAELQFELEKLFFLLKLRCKNNRGR